MRIVCVGGGPGGLYFAVLMKKADPGHDIPVIEGNRPGVAERLGVGPERLQGINPRLIYCGISGFGNEGPWKDRPAFDSLSLSGAARYSDSDLFESETGTKFSVNWGPTENLMLRASYAEGFRAPNIGELFNLGSRFDSGLTREYSLLRVGSAWRLCSPDYWSRKP